MVFGAKKDGLSISETAKLPPDLNPIEHLWDVLEHEIPIMDVQPTNLQKLHDAIMSIGIKIFENVFSALLNLCHEGLR